MGDRTLLETKDFLNMDRAELSSVMSNGYAIDPNSLDDTMYRGISLGLPKIVDRLLWKTFRKTFHRDPETAGLRGWNVRLEQNGLEQPSSPMHNKRGEQITFGHYHALDARGRRMPKPWDIGLFLDYGAAANRLLDIARWLRAPLIAVNEGSVDLLLGWEYVQLGCFQISTPSFWLLEREGSLDEVVPVIGR